MPNKNSVAGLKTDAPTVIPSKPETTRAPEKKVGRPKVPAHQKRSYKITLSLTEAQGETVREKAGLASEATYLYDQLKKAGVFDGLQPQPPSP